VGREGRLDGTNLHGEIPQITQGYMGQLVEWPEAVTEGATIEKCRALLRDALQEMILAYRQQKKEAPQRNA
jgi:predicted RNase H-like HicB family nuclease